MSLCTDEPIITRFTDCHKALRLYVISVRPDYYRKGIGQRMFEMTMKAGKEAGCVAALGAATSHRTQQYLEKKLGFETTRTIMHSDYLDENGEQIFKCRDGLTNCGKMMMIRM